MYQKSLLAQAAAAATVNHLTPTALHTHAEAAELITSSHTPVVELEITPFQRDAMIAISPSELVKRLPVAAARALGHNDSI